MMMMVVVLLFFVFFSFLLLFFAIVDFCLQYKLIKISVLLVVGDVVIVVVD